MIPLLRRCKELKEAERKVEEPFRKLLKSILIRDGATEEAVDQSLDGLILWWKAKTKNFRPLVGNDDSNRVALQAITDRFTKRVTKTPALASLPIDDYEGLALVVAKDDRTILTYAQAHPLFPTFVHQRTIRFTRGVWALSETKEWVHIPQSSLALPNRLFSDDSILKHRPIKGDGFVPKPALDAIADTPLRGNPLTNFRRDTLKAYAVVAVSGSRKMEVFLVATNSEDKLYWYALRMADGAFSISSYGRGGYSTIEEILERGNLRTGDIHADQWRSYYVAAAVSSDEQQEYVRLIRREAAAGKLRDVKRSYLRLCETSLESFLKTQWREEQMESYLKDGGDPDLFEDHLRTVKKPQFLTDPLDQVLSELLFRASWSIKRVSTTPLSSLLDEAIKSHNSREKGFFDRSSIPNELVIPDGFSLPSPKPR